jgi:hypothetical protein
MAYDTENAPGPTELPQTRKEAAEKRAEAERKGSGSGAKNGNSKK